MLQYIPVVTGVWLVVTSLILNTKNITSALIFKVIPFFLGLGTILFNVKYLGII